MKDLLNRYLPMRAPEEGAGAGAAAQAPAAAASSGGDQQRNPQSPVAGSGAAADGGGSPSAASLHRPEGLPDTMYGKDDRETIDKLANAVKGYRQRDSAAVPDKVEPYAAFKAEELPETVRGHMKDLAKDPLFLAAAETARAEKIPVAQFQKITASLYEAAAKAGILEPPLDVDAERLALLPDAAKSLPKDQQDKAIDARMQANQDFVTLMTQQGLDKGAAEHGLLMLMDTAKGNQLLEFFRSKLTGGDNPQPLTAQGGKGGGADKRTELRERMAAPEMDPQHPKFSRAAYDALSEEYRKAFGD